ncbi:hypothetical protein C8Q77DRAFT_1155579 [Trametes polyzona]|nr:hypothetical protein C8Q77DRAFT_1155579 [Trametes polyzona]
MPVTVDPYAFFDVTIGVTLIALAVTGSLFGVSTSQVVWYFKHYPRDRKSLKMLWITVQTIKVALVWGFDALHLILYGATMWNYLVMKEVQAMGTTLLPWESSAQLLCNACAIVTIQSFYSYRIWTLSQNRYLTALLIVFICGDFALAVTLFMKRSVTPPATIVGQFPHDSSPLSIMTHNVQDFIGLTSLDVALSSVTASTDVLLSGTLVILLAMSRTGSAGANRLIYKLVLYTINTGALTSFFAVVSLVTVIIMPTTSVYVMFYYIGTRLYSVSLLATLNARESLRIQAERIGHVTLPRLSSLTASRLASTASKQPVVVAIQHNSAVAFEEDDEESGLKSEMYHRTRGGHHEHVGDGSEGSGSSVRECEWDPVKLKSGRVAPMY